MINATIPSIKINTGINRCRTAATTITIAITITITVVVTSTTITMIMVVVITVAVTITLPSFIVLIHIIMMNTIGAIILTLVGNCILNVTIITASNDASLSIPAPVFLSSLLLLVRVPSSAQ